MQELIKITEREGRSVVSARELYEFLGFDRSNWSKWYRKNILGNPFAVEKEDWEGFVLSTNGNQTQDFALTIDFAKRLAMMAKTTKGEEARNYFLECERVAKATAPALPDFTNPVLAARAWADELEKRLLTEARVAELAPKAHATDVLLTATNSISVADFAKVIGYGPIKLFDRMRMDGFLIPRGDSYNVPYQRFIEAGYFEVKETTIKIGDRTEIKRQSRITPKGQVYFASRYRPARVLQEA